MNYSEERLNYPGLSIIDFEFINYHPEAKQAIWNRYNSDIVFKVRIDERMKNDLMFAYQFRETFKYYIERGKGR